MLSVILLFALAASSPASDRPCPPAGFEHAGYVNPEEAASLVAAVQRQLSLRDHPWAGRAGMEGRPASVNLDLYVQPDGKVAGVCVISGEHRVFAAVAEDLKQVNLRTKRSFILPLDVKIIWRSTRTDLDLQEFRSYDLKVTAAERP